MSLKKWFCKLFHSSIKYAGFGTYTCRRCGCTFPAPWADTRG